MFAKDPALLSDGTRQLSLVALCTNFPPAEPEIGDSLLTFNNVIVLFHEFGHVLHHTLSRSDFTEFEYLLMLSILEVLSS